MQAEGLEKTAACSFTEYLSPVYERNDENIANQLTFRQRFVLHEGEASCERIYPYKILLKTVIFSVFFLLTTDYSRVVILLHRLMPDDYCYRPYADHP